MGFSTSGAVALLFIAGLLAAGLVVPTLFSISASTGDAFATQNEQIRDMANTDIDVIVAENTTIEDGEPVVTVEAKNTGTETLDLGETYLLLDGELIEAENLETSVDGNDETAIWPSGSTAEFETDSEATERAKLVTEGAIADVDMIEPIEESTEGEA